MININISSDSLGGIYSWNIIYLYSLSINKCDLLS